MTKGHRNFQTRALSGLAGIAICSGVGFAADTAPKVDSQEALQAQVRQLQAEVDALKARETARDNAAPQQSAAPAAIDITVSAVQADADRHSPLFADAAGMTAGYIPGKGFVIKSDDGNFLLHPWAYLQARYATNYREKAKNGNTDSATDTGFEIARLKFVLDGNVFSPDFTYQFIWNSAKSGGTLALNDAWARYQFHDSPFAIQGGQIRNPLDHEQILFATQTLTVDRSLVDDLFAAGEGLVEGVDVNYGYNQNGPLRAEAAFTHGLRNTSVTFQDFPTTSANWGTSARAEWKFMGDWTSYDRFTSLGAANNLLVLGAGADYTEAGDSASLVHVVDAQYNMKNGLALYAAYLGRYTKNNAGPIGTNGGSTSFAAHPDTYDATGRLMVAYLFNQHIEPFLRYEYIQFDPNEIASTARGDNIHDITLGANYYFYGQRAKLSTNIIYLPNGCPVSDSTVNDILASPSPRNQVVFQMQFQLII